MANARAKFHWAQTAQLTAMIRTVFLGVAFKPEKWTPFSTATKRRKQSPEEIKEGFANLSRFFRKG